MIPAVAHFIWFGPSFPWLHRLAIGSALERGGFERVVLHHDSDLGASDDFRALCERPGFEARPMDFDRLYAALPGNEDALRRLFGTLTKPNARANLVRAALLASEGGVYLDMDTVTVAPLDDLRADAGVFCGEEIVAFPRSVTGSWAVGPWARSWALTALRDGYRRLPDGWRRFRNVQDRYPRAVNNAVLASAPGHPFTRGLLQAMVDLPERRQTKSYALGTHLLQEQVAAYTGEGLVVHRPEVFYPLGPEISEHWFRPCKQPRLDQVLSRDTRVVHWYASVRTRHIVDRINPDFVRAHADSQLLSALADPFLATV